MKLQTRLIAGVLSLMVVLFSGCSTDILNAESLMRPPKLTGDKAEIQKLVEKTVGKNITFKYPQSGDERAPIIITDLLKDGSKQAIAFYSPNDDTKAGTNLMVMNKADTNWEVSGIFEDQGNDIDKVCFGDINEDGRNEIVVGWASFQNSKNVINAYSFDGITTNKMNLIDTYTKFVLADLDNEAGDELMLFSLNTMDSPAMAELIKFDNQKQEIVTIDVIEMDSDAISYESIKTGRSDDYTLGVFVDEALSGNKMSTEFIYWDNEQQRLVNPLYSKKKFEGKTFERYDNALSADVNDDGFIEIPAGYNIPGYTQSAEDICTSVWLKYHSQNNSLVEIEKTVINTKYKYIFRIPDNWENKVTVNYEGNTLTFSEWVMGDNHVESCGEALLSILVLPSNSSSTIINDEYILLTSDNNMDYFAFIQKQDSSLSLTKDEIINSFELYN